MRAFILASSNLICSEIGARSKALRLARNLTQVQLAAMLEVSLSSLRRFEANGQGSLDMVVKIAQALHVTQDLEPLFLPSQESIAQLEQWEKASGKALRKRASP